MANFELSLSIKTKKDHLEPFERDQLFLSVYSACGHRKDAQAAATALTATIINKILSQIKDATVQRTNIVETAFETLKRFDRSASVHYRAYHPL